MIVASTIVAVFTFASCGSARGEGHARNHRDEDDRRRMRQRVRDSAATRRNGALTLAANIASKDASAKVSVGPHTENPALLTRISMSPTSLAKRAMLAASARSGSPRFVDVVRHRYLSQRRP